MKRIWSWASLGAMALSLFAFSGLARADMETDVGEWLTAKPARVKVFIQFKVRQIIRELNGTVSQFQEGRAFASELGDAVVARIEAKTKFRKALLEEWKKDTVDTASLATVFAEDAIATAELLRKVGEGLTRLHSMLSAEQRAALAKEWSEDVQCEAPIVEEIKPEPEPEPEPEVIPEPAPEPAPAY